MNDLEKACELINRIEAAHFSGPKSEQLIAAAERALSLTFPADYRQFVSRLGCGSVPGFEVYGVIDDDFENSGIPDAVWLTLNERQTSELPPSLVIVSHTGDGGYFAIDLSQSITTGNCPVIEWWPGLPYASGNGRVVATDFGSFLLERIQATL